MFKALEELFPQVDHRILKAVAIEHHKDVNAAVEFILSEVVPSTEGPVDAYHGLIDDKNDGQLPICSPKAPLAENQDVAGLSSCHEEQGQLSEHQQGSQEATLCHLLSDFVASEPDDDSHRTREVSECSSTCLLEEPTSSSEVSSPDRKCPDKVGMDIKTEEMTSGAEKLLYVYNRSTMESPATSSSMKHVALVFYDCDNIDDATVPALDEPETCETNISVCTKSCLIATANETENKTGALNSSCVSEDPQELLQEAAHNESSFLRTNFDSEGRGSFEIVSEETDLNSEPADPKDESYFPTGITQSGQICRIDVLEDAINEAKNNKKTLFSSMESVINMMKKAEDLETAADEAKEEAVKGGLDILSKVEELRKMLLHAKEANDMHAGEVYGEKAILATEARELQGRLLNLSNERNRSLAILDEMRQVLEARLAVAEEVLKAAEQDKLLKEESARKALLEQELIMEKVVQESKRLQREAEENSKLREFLMDRGQIVDVLQGEMSVICMDIKSLKENFDDRAPLSKSLTSSQTSCILALSGSSGKSLAPNFIPEKVESTENLTTPVDNLTENNTSDLSEDGKQIVDDDGAFFEKRSTIPVDNLSEKITSEWRDDRMNLVEDDWTLPKMICPTSLDNLSEKSSGEWSEDRMNSMIDDWALPETRSTMHYDSLLEKSTSQQVDVRKNLLDDDWDLL